MREPTDPKKFDPLATGSGRVRDAIRTLILAAGDNPDRPGLLKTPARVERAMQEWFSGYSVNPTTLLEASFDSDGFEGEVFVRGISVLSHCEHHLAPIVGTAAVAYVPLPSGRVVGLSKIPRLVDAFARRLQLQERLTQQVAETLWAELREPRGVAVIIRATHHCMLTRGVKQADATMATTRFFGDHYTEDRRRDFIARSGLG